MLNQRLQVTRLAPDLVGLEPTTALVKLNERISKNGLDIERLWAKFVQMVETQQITTPPTHQDEIGEYNGYPVSIYRRDRRDEVVLYHVMLGTSHPLARVGRDDDNISSAYKARWLLTGSARQLFEQWLHPQRLPGRWSKAGAYWQRKW